MLNKICVDLSAHFHTSIWNTRHIANNLWRVKCGICKTTLVPIIFKHFSHTILYEDMLFSALSLRRHFITWHLDLRCIIYSRGVTITVYQTMLFNINSESLTQHLNFTLLKPVEEYTRSSFWHDIFSFIWMAFWLIYDKKWYIILK